MPKNEIVVVNSLKSDLKKEAKVQGEQLLDKCLIDAKDHLAVYADYAVRRVIDQIREYLHDKFAA